MPAALRLRAALEIARSRQDGYLTDLSAWLAIPSVSAEPLRSRDVARAAQWLAAWLRRRGGQVRLLPTRDHAGRAGPPVVAGMVRGRGPGLVIVYGHYDVRPAGSGWSTPAFRLTRCGRELRGRGMDDDKGQLFAHLAALDAWVAVGGPPHDVLVLAEGAEEIGSPGLRGALATLPTSCLPTSGPVRAVVVSDTERAGLGVPSLTVSQRGMIGADVTVDAGGPAVHPGRFGGAVADPGAVLCRLIDQLRDLVADLPVAPPLTRAVARPDDDLRRAASGRALREAGLERRVTRTAALSVTRLRAGERGGVVPRTSSARLDIRLPPGLDPAPVVQAMYRCAAEIAPPPVRVDFDVRAAARGLLLVPPDDVARAIDRACRTGFGTRPRRIRSGGTIPALEPLQEAFGVRPVLVGLGRPAARAHAPDERADLDGWRRSSLTCVALHEALAVRTGRVTALTTS